MNWSGAERDDLGNLVPIPPRVRRVVSIVPSLTEALAATDRDLLVGATEWCSHPGDLDVPRVRGTKNPDVVAIAALAPDVVLANEEENREPDLQALRDAGIAVWVTRIRTVPEAFVSLRRMLTLACRCPSPDWLGRAEAVWVEAAWADTAGGPVAGSETAIIPIWRRPWMVIGRDTFAGDVLLRLGVRNVYADHPERYPRVPLEELIATRADLVVLPDEPYRFTAEDGPEAFAAMTGSAESQGAESQGAESLAVETRVVLVSGRLLTWYGPSLEHAPQLLLSKIVSSG